jgi:tRNA 2-thiouridine synthesizing protein E
MAQVNAGGKFFPIDEHGHLADFGAWAPEWAVYVFMNVKKTRYHDGKVFYSRPLEPFLVAEWNGELTEAQKGIITFYRNFFEKNGRAPLVRETRKQTGLSLPQLFDIAPWAGIVGLIKAAGLPRPEACV